jgi:threonine/homoserine efflux transporter RhtA
VMIAADWSAALLALLVLRPWRARLAKREMGKTVDTL